MVEFYTSVDKIGKNIFYTGYKDGKKVTRKIKYQPTLYLKSDKDTGLRTLKGVPVDPVRPGDMNECYNFIALQEGSGVTVYGNTDYVAQFISDNFPDDVDFNPTLVKVTKIDIEVDPSDGFPEPSNALKTVTAITIKNSRDDIYYSWGMGEFDPDEIFKNDPDKREALKGKKIVYTRCKNEEELLTLFLDHWCKNYPDIVTGWNSTLFDMTYLVNRVKNVFGEVATKRFSIHKIKPYLKKNKFGDEYYNIAGLVQLDYIELFKKFCVPAGWGNQPSYKLDHVAEVVLKEKKLDYSEYSSLNKLYVSNHPKFMSYNVWDTALVDRMDEKLGLIDLVLTLAYRTKVTYDTTLGSTRIWDTYIYNVLRESGIVVSPQEGYSGEFKGGYVKPPICGKHEWLVSLDLKSQYPHNIMQYNISPETISKQRIEGVTPDFILNGKRYDIPENHCLTAGGQLFRTDKKGVFPLLVENLYNERDQKKVSMIKAKKRLEKMDKDDPDRYSIEIDIARLNNEQSAIKVLMNSLYGAMGNRWFRYYDVRMAEAITLSGQLSIHWASRDVNNYLTSIGFEEKDRIVAMDTDSLYIDLSDLVKKYVSDKTDDEKCDFLCKVVDEKIIPVIDKSYIELGNIMGVLENKISMKREVIASEGLWTGKKRYVLNVLDDEGVRYQKPKMKITGLETKRSSTPEVCRNLITKTLKMIMNSSEDEVQKFIADVRSKFRKLPVEEVAFPRGVSEIHKHEDGSPVGYAKATPIHSRAAILYNRIIEEKSLTKTHERIREGDKIRFTYLKMPNPINENVIGFPIILPDELGLRDYVDHDMQFEKGFVNPIESVMTAIGWNVEKVNSLEDFFG